ncbi:MAG: CbtA family protein [Defluviicoccus sp.]|nr:CbtA family protein [Defluviicoccus sp.]MDE0386404.1 CbtA family protein [Defluviicoccus sp.]
MFSRILVGGLFAGFLAGAIAAVLQLAFVQPVLLQAELYESGRLVHFGAARTAGAAVETAGIDLWRDGLSVLFAILLYTGYALVLVAAMALAAERGIRITARQGLIWGMAGFVSVQLAPALGVPPELPGTAAADIELRRAWWVVTVAATAAGLALVAFGKGWTMRGVAAALILAPHVVGAPHPASFAGPAPPEIGSLFAARALGVGLAAWALLGLLGAWFWLREGNRREDAQRAA